MRPEIQRRKKITKNVTGKKKQGGAISELFIMNILEGQKTDGWVWTNSQKLRTIKLWPSFWSYRKENLWYAKGIIFIETLSEKIVQIKNIWLGLWHFSPHFIIGFEVSGRAYLSV